MYRVIKFALTTCFAGLFFSACKMPEITIGIGKPEPVDGYDVFYCESLSYLIEWTIDENGRCQLKDPNQPPIQEENRYPEVQISKQTDSRFKPLNYSGVPIEDGTLEGTWLMFSTESASTTPTDEVLWENERSTCEINFKTGSTTEYFYSSCITVNAAFNDKPLVLDNNSTVLFDQIADLNDVDPSITGFISDKVTLVSTNVIRHISAIKIEDSEKIITDIYSHKLYVRIANKNQPIGSLKLTKTSAEGTPLLEESHDIYHFNETDEKHTFYGKNTNGDTLQIVTFLNNINPDRNTRPYNSLLPAYVERESADYIAKRPVDFINKENILKFSEEEERFYLRRFDTHKNDEKGLDIDFIMSPYLQFESGRERDNGTVM